MDMTTNNKRRDPRGTHLYSNLRKSISNGELNPGECLPSARELQKEYGISYHATLAALARLGQEGLVVRKQGSGTYVADSPNLTGGDGQGTTIRVIESYSSHFSEMFLEPLASAVREELEKLECRHSVSVLRKESTWSLEDWAQRIRAATEVGDADVVLHICPSEPWLSLPTTRPTVFVAQDMETAWTETSGFDVVTVNARQSGAIASRYLREIGCKRVAMVGVRYADGRLSPHSYQRLRGFEMERDAAIPESMMFTCKRHTPSSGAEVVPEILALDPLPDAVFAATDDLAQGLCHALLAHGIQPGRDMKVIGCDGQPPLYPQDPILTSVAAPLPELGRAAVRMALQRAKNPESVAQNLLLTCTLRKGDTA